jgi:tetratricopeptide (TPR) repeat protein
MRTPESLKRSVEFFQKVTQIDPQFAPAWAGLANSYNLYYDYGLAAPQDSFPMAREAAEKALSLDGTLSEAHATLASVKAEFDWNWAGAEQEFKLALQFDPDNPTAHQWYSELLLRTGRFTEAMKEISRARELDHLSSIITAEVGGDLYWIRQYDEAIQRLSASINLYPHLSYTHSWRGFAYLQKGMTAAAIEDFETARKLSPDSPTYKADLGYALALDNHPGEARHIARELETANHHVSPFDIAMVYTGLGDKDIALQWLEKAFAERDPGLDLLKIEPALDSLRSDPRFVSLLERVGLPADLHGPSESRARGY